MSFRLVPVVEGEGEAKAVPVLLRGIATWLAPERHVSVQRPVRVPRDSFVRNAEERRKALAYAVHACLRANGSGHILVLLDADDDCPATAAPALAESCAAIVGDRTGLSVVLANREYEAWFLASRERLQGIRDFDLGRLREHWDEVDPDAPRNAKGLVREATGRRYGPVKDQAALSAKIDPRLACERSRSFRKLVDECRRALEVP